MNKYSNKTPKTGDRNVLEGRSPEGKALPIPIAIATWNFGKAAVEAAGKLLEKGVSALDAVEAGINVTELDEKVTSVGFGGLPNCEGIVELDAAIMDGLTHNAGSVASLRDIKRPISVARKVMERTPHVMLVGEGAKKFALSQGFSSEYLLTEKSKQRWEEWKATKGAEPSEKRATRNTSRFAGSRESGHHATRPALRDTENRDITRHATDTIGLVALDLHGNLSVGCSTSGLAYKLGGRVGDSPLIGSGLYVDNDVGGASATGLGEEILKFCASFLVVEFMRNGLTPMEACQKTIDRIPAKRKENEQIMIALIALNKKGEHGAAATQKGFSYALWRPSECAVIEV